MKIANIDREFLHIFTKNIKNHKKVTKNQGSTLPIEDTFFKKSQGGGVGRCGGGQFNPLPPDMLGLRKYMSYYCIIALERNRHCSTINNKRKEILKSINTTFAIDSKK